MNRIMTNKVNNIEDCSSPLWCFDKLAYVYNYRSQILGCDNFVCIYLLKKKKLFAFATSLIVDRKVGNMELICTFWPF